MKKTICTISALLLAGALFAQSLSGYDIMKKSDEVPDPKTYHEIVLGFLYIVCHNSLIILRVFELCHVQSANIQ